MDTLLTPILSGWQQAREYFSSFSNLQVASRERPIPLVRLHLGKGVGDERLLHTER